MTHPYKDDVLIPSLSHNSNLDTAYPGLHPRYAIIMTIATSLYGSVVLGKDTQQNCLVAIKISKLIFSTPQISSHSGNQVLDNLENEERIMIQLQSTSSNNHHIVKLLDVIEDDEYHYLITPYYNRGDLCRYTEPKSEMEVLSIFNHLIDGVSYMHQHGIAHCDLSLENIMLHQGENGLEAYIIDFGIARVNPNGANTSKFPCNPAPLVEKPGKREYISPELWSDTPWDCYSNDIFALGVILFCMLNRHHPFYTSTDETGKFYTSGKWYKVLKCLDQGTMKPSDIRSEDYNYWVKPFQHLSIQVLDLISHLLCPESSRYTLQQIKQHPWCLQPAQQPQQQTSPNNNDVVVRGMSLCVIL